MMAEQMTREQVAAYLISQSVCALGELMALHWENVNHQIGVNAGAIPPGTPVPHGIASFNRCIERNTISFHNTMSLFERQEMGRYGRPGSDAAPR